MSIHLPNYNIIRYELDISGDLYNRHEVLFRSLYNRFVTNLESLYNWYHSLSVQQLHNIGLAIDNKLVNCVVNNSDVGFMCITTGSMRGQYVLYRYKSATQDLVYCSWFDRRL